MWLSNALVSVTAVSSQIQVVAEIDDIQVDNQLGEGGEVAMTSHVTSAGGRGKLRPPLLRVSLAVQVSSSSVSVLHVDEAVVAVQDTDLLLGNALALRLYCAAVGYRAAFAHARASVTSSADAASDG